MTRTTARVLSFVGFVVCVAIGIGWYRKMPQRPLSTISTSMDHREWNQPRPNSLDQVFQISGGPSTIIAPYQVTRGDLTDGSYLWTVSSIATQSYDEWQYQVGGPTAPAPWRVRVTGLSTRTTRQPTRGNAATSRLWTIRQTTPEQSRSPTIKLFPAQCLTILYRVAPLLLEEARGHLPLLARCLIRRLQHAADGPYFVVHGWYGHNTVDT